MKLFVWHGNYVLQDYTSGMICVVAENLEDALKAIEKECSYADGNFPSHPTDIIDLNDNTKPRAWVCWGGG